MADSFSQSRFTQQELKNIFFLQHSMLCSSYQKPRLRKKLNINYFSPNHLNMLCIPKAIQGNAQNNVPNNSQNNVHNITHNVDSNVVPNFSQEGDPFYIKKSAPYIVPNVVPLNIGNNESDYITRDEFYDQMNQIKESIQELGRKINKLGNRMEQIEKGRKREGKGEE